MSLLRFSNSHPFAMNRFFNNEVMNGLNTDKQTTSVPLVNITETNEGFLVEVAAPGYDKSDFKLELNRNVLSISAETKTGSNENTNYTHREFNYQSFSRTFSVPTSADGEKIEASYTNGILHVSIPKREESKPKPARLIAVA